jgi:hypothetical protein
MGVIYLLLDLKPYIQYIWYKCTIQGLVKVEIWALQYCFVFYNRNAKDSYLITILFYSLTLIQMAIKIDVAMQLEVIYNLPGNQ